MGFFGKKKKEDLPSAPSPDSLPPLPNVPAPHGGESMPEPTPDYFSEELPSSQPLPEVPSVPSMPDVAGLNPAAPATEPLAAPPEPAPSMPESVEQSTPEPEPSMPEPSAPEPSVSKPIQLEHEEPQEVEGVAFHHEPNESLGRVFKNTKTGDVFYDVESFKHLLQHLQDIEKEVTHTDELTIADVNIHEKSNKLYKNLVTQATSMKNSFIKIRSILEG